MYNNLFICVIFVLLVFNILREMNMQKYIFSHVSEAKELIQKLLNRHEEGQNIENDVHAILESVRTKGDDFLIGQTRLFDCPQFEGGLRVSHDEIQQGAASIGPEELEIISAAAANIRQFHEAQKENSWFQTKADGTILGQKVSPVHRAGLYVPGGKGGDTPLISSLLMQAIPAQVAGVKDLVIVTPPREDGSINPHLLAAAYLLDITEVYRVGGPWAIGALAYGTESINPVNVITGPGNAYVTMAKKLVQGHVGIDMLAGPSEILIIGDEMTNINYVAADLISQAEHDSLASAVYITTVAHKANDVIEALEKALKDLPRAEIARKSLDDWGAVIIVPKMQVAIDIANALASEHVEVLTKDPWSLVSAIENAGALFLGHWSAEPVGDYFAGPNHVLPTQGTAKYASALSVQTFYKKTSIIAASSNFTRTNAASIASLARLESLEGHARSIEIRISTNS